VKDKVTHCEEVYNGEEFQLCAVRLLPVVSLQLHRYPKCIAKLLTPLVGVNVTDELISISTVVYFHCVGIVLR